MNLNHLQYFRVLAKLEHYTQAAEQLSITQCDILLSNNKTFNSGR